MLRIGVVADTHLPRFGRALPRALVEGLADARVQRILHLGDWTSELAFDLLAQIAPVDGVAGNNDPPSLADRLGLAKVVELGGVRFGLTHGHLGSGRTTPERAASVFRETVGRTGGRRLDAILFGHSHIPLLERPADGPWLLNPGSPTDKRRQPRYTWALVTVQGERLVDAELRAYEDRSV